MKYLIVYGTRPEAIKLAPLIYQLKEANLDVEVCCTAQHRGMLDQVNSFFDIKPDYDLNLMSPGQSLNSLAGNIFIQLDKIISNKKFDWVFVHGDTTTSCVSAWAAFHRRIKVAHVEAGLRTHDMYSPFPEEINRQITARIASIHFSPTIDSCKNLISEGICSKLVRVTGNTIIDSLYLGLRKIDLGFINSTIIYLQEIVKLRKPIILVTSHRRENFGNSFDEICNSIKKIALECEVIVIFPVHLNPNVQEPVFRILNNISNVILLEPLDYPSFIFAMRSSYLILTDSGGVQEEAISLNKPVLVMRNNTERPEGVQVGAVKLVGTNSEIIVTNVKELLHNSESYLKMCVKSNPYGDGKACNRIIEAILTLQLH